MATNGSGYRRLRLYQLIPKRELKLPRNHIVLSTKEDQRIEDAICRAVGGHPTTADAGGIFENLFEQVAFHLRKRPTHGRVGFWRDVTTGWEEIAGVVLDVAEVRRLVLAITLAERRWPGLKSSDTLSFLTNVRVANEFFRLFEAGSDEAVEILAEIAAMRHAPNAFWQPPKQHIPWTTSLARLPVQSNADTDPTLDIFPEPCAAQSHDSEPLSTTLQPIPLKDLPASAGSVVPTSAQRVMSKPIKPIKSRSDKSLFSKTQRRNRRRSEMADVHWFNQKKAQLAAKRRVSKTAKKVAKKHQKQLEEEGELLFKELEEMLVVELEPPDSGLEEQEDGKVSSSQPEKSETHPTGRSGGRKRPIDAAEAHEPSAKKFKFEVVVGCTRPAQ
ncbi:hypothetical protein BR93DRAFT_932560 [Coniochaeta sp. PMI_546]|nr:hypothetical protein BR93DRAFT_932560 [Coniochaeta sp. PMI_546]